ncbi:MAG: hypothetical protein HQM00_14245, partial [Magnetococcales bacterium]|nr:hypothetical protein [Magnetococcales bacterium]
MSADPFAGAIPIDPPESDPFAGAIPIDPPDQSRTWGEFGKDAALSLVKGGVGILQSVVGLADLANVNVVGNGLDAIGSGIMTLADKAGLTGALTGVPDAEGAPPGPWLNPDRPVFDTRRANEWLSSLQSPLQQRSDRAVHDAMQEGFLPTVGAALSNPASVLGGVLEAGPSIALIARGVSVHAARLLASLGVKAGTAEAAAILSHPKVMSSLVMASGVGEGALQAGSLQEQARLEGRDWEQSAPYAVGSGILTALTTMGAGHIPGLGGDLEAKLVAGAQGGIPGKERLIRVGRSIIGEGMAEELPQSYQEQVMQNLAEGKPWDEGAAGAAGMGLLTGMAMGGGMGGFHEARGALLDRMRAAQSQQAPTGEQTPTEDQILPEQPIPAQETPPADSLNAQGGEPSASASIPPVQPDPPLDPMPGVPPVAADTGLNRDITAEPLIQTIEQAFGQQGISRTHLEELLQKPMERMNDDDLNRLRQIHGSLSKGSLKPEEAFRGLQIEKILQGRRYDGSALYDENGRTWPTEAKARRASGTQWTNPLRQAGYEIGIAKQDDGWVVTATPPGGLSIAAQAPIEGEAVGSHETPAEPTVPTIIPRNPSDVSTNQ